MPEIERRLLVIDDDVDLREVIRETFERIGYKVLTATDGAEGLQKTVEDKPDCVILDIRMRQGEDGLDYLRKLRSHWHCSLQEQARIRKTPVIVLTGTGKARQAVFEFEGISGFMEKPFNLLQLQGKIEQILRIR